MSLSSSTSPPPLMPPPLMPPTTSSHFRTLSRDSDADTASQKSISLSSPPASPRNSMMSTSNDSDIDPRQSFATSSSESYSFSSRRQSVFSTIDGVGLARASADRRSTVTSNTSFGGSPTDAMTYPPPQKSDDTASIASTSSKKARPESLLVSIPSGQLILGVALVDFNHIVGPRIEWSRGDIFEDDDVAKILPFLALPDGAHASAEDYSYFHLVQPGPSPTTIFGISCNQQIAASLLLNKPADVTRSTVQKAVVVLASKPIFGPIRDKLRVVTTALFAQRDFSDYSILDDFSSTLELSLRGQLTESGLYMGTSLRELVHTFRQKTLVLVKALILQKRIMFFGYPVERLCTFQYSLVSLLPGLLQTLDDCGSPPLAHRAQTLTKPNSLKTSDRKSMMAFMGLPLDLFGQDALFQPYLPLQQLDMLRNTPSWLCGCTNSIVTHQKEIDLLVYTDTGAFEFRDPQLERSAGLTAADRKWMDEIIRDVNEGWDDSDPTNPQGMKFKGSDDYLRSKFEDYINAALSTVKYRDFVATGHGGGVLSGAGDDSAAAEDFNPLWISEFKRTRAYEVWERVTDPTLFDIIEPRHPCNEKPGVVADIGLRLQEGIQDLKLEQQLAPAREAVARTIATSSENLFKTIEGVRGRWAQRQGSTGTISPTPPPAAAAAETSTRSITPPVETSKSDADDDANGPKTATQTTFFRPFSLAPKSFAALTSPSATSAPATAGDRSSVSSTASSPAPTANATSAPPSGAVSPLAAWGAGWGSFFSEKASQIAAARQNAAAPNTQATSASASNTTPSSANGSANSSPGRPSPPTRSSSTFSAWSSFSALVSPAAAAPTAPAMLAQPNLDLKLDSDPPPPPLPTKVADPNAATVGSATTPPPPPLPALGSASVPVTPGMSSAVTVPLTPAPARASMDAHIPNQRKKADDDDDDVPMFGQAL